MEGTDSEFTCSVARVLGVECHPGADRLDLVTLSLDGTTPYPDKIVASAGDFKPGDLAVYVSPDSEVPIGGPFAFLSSRLDAKGKTRYRLRSARLRGVYSPGLVIPHTGPQGLGVDVSEVLGVTKWEPACADVTYEVSADKQPVKHVPPPDQFPIYAVTSIKKAPFLFGHNESVLITEKIHGTNFRFGFGGNSKFYFGTHRTALADIRGLLRRTWDRLRGHHVRVNTNPGFGNPWCEAVSKFQLETACRRYPELVFYGELFGYTATGRKVQDLTYARTDLSLCVFDVYHGTKRRWLTRDEREHVLAGLVKFHIHGVHPLYEGPFHMDVVKQLAEENSAHGGGIREGVVVEALEGVRRKGKWVSQRYHLRKGG